MRKFYPEKPVFFSSNIPRIRKTLAHVSLLTVLLFASVPCLASHRHAHAAPSPVPIATDAAPSTTTTDSEGWTSTLVTLVILLGGMSAYLFRKIAFLRENFALQAKNLRTESRNHGYKNEELQSQLKDLQAHFTKASGESSAKTLQLSRANEELAQLRVRIQAMIEADPEIENKAKQLAEARARIRAEKEKQEQSRRQQKQAQAKGREKISDLLSQMKRGY